MSKWTAWYLLVMLCATLFSGNRYIGMMAACSASIMVVIIEETKRNAK